MQQKLLPSPGMDWSKLNVLVTGGTGSFGKAFVSTLLNGRLVIATMLANKGVNSFF